MFQIGIIGPESTGKTTLAIYLHNRYGGNLILEYARSYIEQLNGQPYTINDVIAIAKHQIKTMAEIKKQQPPLIFYDTELIITKIWFLEKYKSCPQWLQNAIITYPMNTYLLCYPDLPWQWQTVRENGENTKRMYLFDLYEQEIQKLNIPYYIIRHTDE